MIAVASYCRVSTEKDDQANSFESQQQYFREYIERNADWELYDLYADEGISGTSTKKRTQFNRMIQDAYEGKFRLILTKEVSRFSRNILDTISYTRQLREMGIGVIFLTDNINTLEPEAEMLLSFLASLAQEESRRTSARVVWGQTRQMEKGVVFGHSLLGYDVKDGVLSIDPAGAETVRLIFHMYAEEQMATSEIARLLTERGCLTQQGSSKWTAATVLKILHNEKYVGDLVQKKTFTPDFLTHEKKANKGEVSLITIRNHHRPIIDRDVWDLTQQRLHQNNKHRQGGGGHSNRYVFSGKIKCGTCGAGFVGRNKYLKDGASVRRWSCATAVREGVEGCDVGKLVRDDDAFKMLEIAVNALHMDRETIVRNVARLVLDTIQSELEEKENSERLQSQIKQVQKKKEALMDSYFSEEISKEEMRAMKQKYDGQLCTLRKRLHASEQQNNSATDTALLQQKIEGEAMAILTMGSTSEVFCKNMAACMTVFKDRHIELRLQHLQHEFYFVC